MINLFKLRHLLLFSALYIVQLSCYSDITKTVGATGANYETLKLAFDAINAGTIKTGVITLQLIDNTTETASAVLYQSGYTGAGGVSNYSSVNIYPTTSNISITGNFNSPIITLNGADNVTLDGRVGGVGTTKSLTLTNSSTYSGAVIVRYINTAEQNTIKYCTLKASPDNNGTGIIYFTGSASTNGNNYNIVEYCDITNNGLARPLNAIFSSGTSGLENKFNIIRNNNIYNAFSPSASSYNINISNSSSDWTISNNSFYETSTLVPTGAWKYYPIFVNTGNNHIITNNYIGGTQAECGGTAMIINASKPHYYAGIFINGGLVNKSTIENNIIRNMSYTSTNSNPWDGIFINSGNVDVIGNTIGAETGTGSIIITTPAASATAIMSGGAVTGFTIVGGGSGYTSAPSITFSTAGSTVAATATANLNSDVVTSITLNSGGTGYTGTPTVSFDGSTYSTSHGMIQNSAGIVNILNNKTGSITTVGSATYSHGFESIYVRTLNASAVTNIQNNLYGSLTTPNSIDVSSTATSSPQKQDVYGIYSSSVGTTTISGNTVANLTNRYEGINSGSKTRGIQTTAGTNTILNNTVRNLSTTSGNSGKKTSATIIGISQTSTSGTSQIVKGNKVYDIYNTNTNQRNNVIGIFFSNTSGGSNSVTENFVHSLSCSSSDYLSEIDGIVLFNGLTTTANNIVNIGTGVSNGYLMYGIWDEGGATNNNSIYFNSVYLAGTVTTGTTANTAALWNNFNTSTRNYRNNIFYNARTGGSAGKHYAIVLAGVANTTIDYNDYYYAGSVLGKIGTLERTNLANWKIGTSQDVNSLNTDPGFTDAGSTTDTDYRTGVTVLPGVSVAAVTVDYANAARAITPKMGAYEGVIYKWTGATSTNFATASNWEGSEVPPTGADISFAETPTNHCILDQNRSLRSITNAQSTKNFVLNGKQFTLTGNVTFTNSAKIDATAANSKIIFAGTAAQSIPSGSFVNNTVDSLAVNNASGLTLNGDFTIEKGIALVAGNFAIGANTLTFNGIVTALTGTLTGGTSTNMIIGGAGGAISMPALTLANLTINRATGVNMIGNVNIASTLTLTSGTLTVGANTLTLSGSTPVRTSGNINASNAAASVVFANPSAITLPASLFAGDIQQLTLNTSAGVTAGGNLSIAGNLNLNAANPSDVKGLLDMDATYELEMKGTSTTTGAGDVTGRIVRNTITPETTYTFGNELSTMRFYNAAVDSMPTKIKFIVAIGSTHAKKSNTIKRYYQIVRTGGATPTRFTLNLHYLESELNGITESNLVFWDHHIPYAGTSPHEHGKTELNTDQNWISLSGHSIFYLAQNDYFGELAYVLGATQSQAKIWMMSAKESTSNYVWLGSVSSSWGVIANWSGSLIPTTTSDVIIPNNTPHPAKLPNDSTREVKSISIEAGGRMEGGTNSILNVKSISIEAGGTMEGGGSTINVNGALEENNGTVSWLNAGTFEAGTSTVVFKRTNASIAGNTNFYNITIPHDSCSLLLISGSTTRVSNTFSKTSNSSFNANYNGVTTFGYNGAAQTVVLPLNSNYYNLELSGSDTKTMPASALGVLGNFSTSETTTTTAAAAITIGGNMTIGDGTTFNTGNFNHSIAGNFENNGTFNAAAGYGVIMNGTAAQTIGGTTNTNFDKLTINNSAGATLLTNENVNNELILTAGNLNVGATTLGINGTISKTSGLLNVSSLSSLNFGGTDALTLPNSLFSSTPSINNLTINRSGGVMLGNQSFTVNGLLNLSAGTLTLAANTLTLAGNSPTRSSGNIDASNTSATMAFANADAIVLPASIFTGNVNNFTITSGGTGGVTSSSDFTINGVLSLLSANPSDTKGSLEMTNNYGTYPGTDKTVYLDSHILTLGAAATTVGIGDVTGTVKRTTIVTNTTYTFGNQYTTLTLTDGTMPYALAVTTTIGTSAPAINVADVIRAGIKRMYEIVPTVPEGYTSTPKVNATFHYLDSELTSSNLISDTYYTNTESNLVPMDYDIQGTENLSFEHRRSSFDFANNYIGLSNIPISYFIKKTDHDWRTIFSLRDYVTGYSVWNGSESTDWETDANWTPAAMPTAVSNVIIPDISTTLHQCVLASNKTVNTMTIENGGALTMGSNTLSLSGGWEDQNTLGNNPGTSKVVFSTSGTSLSGTTRFYDVEIATGADITNQAASTMKIANSITRTGTGKWYADMNNTTIEYNGAAQTVALPDGTKHYHNLTLSGSGIKTLPVAPLAMNGNLNLSGTASTTISDVVTVGGNLSLASGTALTVSPSKMLDIAGTISNNAGVNGLLIKSSSTLPSGTLIYHNAANAPVQATVEMYSKASWTVVGNTRSDFKWQFFGIPVKTSAYAMPLFEGSYVRKHNEAGSNTTSNLWIQLANGNAMQNINGYEIAQVAPTIYSFTGELYNQSFTKTLSYTPKTSGSQYPGQHLIGNPYTAAIDINAISFDNNTQAIVYLYNTGSLSNWTSNKGSVSSDSLAYTAGQYTAITKGTAGHSTLPRQIPSMQGFMIKTLGTTPGSVTINYDAVKQKNFSVQRAKQESLSSMRFNLIGATADHDVAWIFSHEGTTRGYDNGWDAPKMAGDAGTARIQSVEADNNYQINTVPDIHETVLSARAGKNDTQYKLVVTNENMLSNYNSIYLLDLKTNALVDISQSRTEYFFSMTNTSSEPRFKILTSAGLTTEVVGDQSGALKIYSSGNTIYIINATNENATMNLYDLSGRLVLQKQIESNNNTSLNVSFETGLYIAKVKTASNKIETSKTLKIDGNVKD